LQTESFGNVPCNGMIVHNNSEADGFDTPVNDEISEELIPWIQQDLKSNIKPVIATHFHDDCLGGLNQFHKHHIPSVAFFKTIEIAKEKQLPVPQEHFDESLEMTVGNERVLIDFFGEGHTKDNIVGYFPSEKILFGGCLIKELNAGKGNLEDANEKDWPQTVKNLKAAYPEIKTIIPGHGMSGNNSLLDYTIRLFSKKFNMLDIYIHGFGTTGAGSNKFKKIKNYADENGAVAIALEWNEFQTDIISQLTQQINDQ